MILLSELHPDVALKSLLEGNVSIAISDDESRIADIYRQGERPNVDLSDEFIEILPNGVIQSMVKPMGLYRGNLAVMIYCKAQSDGTAKFNRINSILGQVERLVHCKSNGKYFFEINLANLITPFTYNSSTGYTSMILNVSWNTTE